MEYPNLPEWKLINVPRNSRVSRCTCIVFTRSKKWSASPAGKKQSRHDGRSTNTQVWTFLQTHRLQFLHEHFYKHLEFIDRMKGGGGRLQGGRREREEGDLQAWRVEAVAVEVGRVKAGEVEAAAAQGVARFRWLGAGRGGSRRRRREVGGEGLGRGWQRRSRTRGRAGSCG